MIVSTLKMGEVGYKAALVGFTYANHDIIDIPFLQIKFLVQPNQHFIFNGRFKSIRLA